MERNARIIMVSTFLLLTLAGLVLFYQWVRGPDPEEAGTDWDILFDGSVSGLSIGSEVRYLGVPVGRVKKIALSKDFPGRVDVVFGTRETLPPADTLVALLEAQGITGLSIIELRDRSGENPGFDVPEGVIPGYPSLFSQLSGSASRITGSLENTLSRLDNLFDQRTTEDLKASIGHLRTLSANLDRASADIDTLMSSARNVSTELEAAMPEFRAVARRLDGEVLPAVAAAGRSLESASEQVSAALGDNRDELESLLARDLPTLIGLADDLATTLQEMDELLSNINDEPGALLYGRNVTEVEIPVD